jgi:beta-lactamase regulating signal transducer with metallopeptidase domain
MSALIQWYPGYRALDFVLVVALGVSLLSSAGWVVARRLVAKPATRHLVLFAALLSCLAFPALAWFFSASGVTFVTIRVLPVEPATIESARAQTAPEPIVIWPEQLIDRPGWAVEYDPRGSRQLDWPRVETGSLAPSRNVTVASVPVTNTVRSWSGPQDPNARDLMNAANRFTSMRGFAALVFIVWGSGVLWLLASLAWSYWRVVQVRRWARPAGIESLQHLFAEIGRKLGVERLPQLLVSRRALTPIAVGFGRPAVILPERLLGAVSDDELCDVLVHELAHIQRRDHRVVLLSEVARALYWPIVPVHALNRELERAREDLCDNVVLTSRDALSYGETLLHVAELLLDARPIRAAAGILHWRGKLERRVAGLLDPGRSKLAKTSRGLACVMVTVFILGGTIGATTRFGAAGSSAKRSGATVESDLSRTRQEAAAAAVDVAPQPAPATQKPPPAVELDDPQLAGHFSGRVLGPDGNPLAGARIYIGRDDPKLKEIGPVRARTDSDGRFAFDAPDMTYAEDDGLPARRQGLLIATLEGYAPDWMVTWGQNHGSFHSHWDPVKGADLALDLGKDDVAIHGRFLDPAGRPLASARVELVGLLVPVRHDLDWHLEHEAKRYEPGCTDYQRELHRPHMLPGVVTETRTDATGRFTMSGLGRDRLALLKVSAPPVVDTDITVMTRLGRDVGTWRDREGNPTQMIYGAGFVLQLKPGLTVRGVVRDSDTHAPIPGMWVGPRGASLNGLNDGAYPTATDEHGRFTITGLDPVLAGMEITAVPQPGRPYVVGTGVIDANKDVVIECKRGIPFRLKVVDEEGKPVEADVTYQDINPNPYVAALRTYDARWPIDVAARKSDGSYEGFVLPGPGAVLVKTLRGFNYRPACVDPRAFFAPGRTSWTDLEKVSSYGTTDALSIHAGWGAYQFEYAAIVLVNPPIGAGPLELSATVARDRPRRVALIDPEGRPVVGAEAHGLSHNSWYDGPPLRAATFEVAKLHPDRIRRMSFVKTDRKLVGFLLVRGLGDGDVPYTVRMQPWGTLTGRLVDEKGNALPPPPPEFRQQMPATLELGTGNGPATTADPGVGEHPGGETNASGSFRLERLVPGQRYTAKVFRGFRRFAGLAFENIVLRPGETRDLGDIRTKPPVNDHAQD